MESRTTILQWTLSAFSNFWNIAQCWDLSQKNNKKHMEILDRSQIWIWWRELSTSWRSSVCLLTRFNLSDLILNLTLMRHLQTPPLNPSLVFYKHDITSEFSCSSAIKYYPPRRREKHLRSLIRSCMLISTMADGSQISAELQGDFRNRDQKKKEKETNQTKLSAKRNKI